MDQFLETYSMPRPIQEDTENLNRPTDNCSFSWIGHGKNATEDKVLDQMASQVNVYHTFKGELVPTLRKLVPEAWERREGFQAHLTKPALLWYQTKPDKDIRKRENYRPVSLMIVEAKMLNNIWANWIQQDIKKIVPHDQVGFIPGVQGGFNICKSPNEIDHINKTKDKKSAIVTTDAGKAFDKIQHPFMMKTHDKAGLEGTHFDTIKALYDEPTAH